MRHRGTVLVAILAAVPLMAQDTRALYERAAKFQEAAKGAVLNLPSEVQWVKEGGFLFYRVDLGGKAHQWVKVDAKGVKSPAFDHAALAKALEPELGKSVEAKDLPIERVEFTEAQTLRFRIDRKAYTCALKDYKVSESTGERRRREVPEAKKDAKSPDGRMVAAVEDHNVVVKELRSGKVLLRSQDGNFADGYLGSFFWSPDSKKLVAVRTVKVEERKVHFVESSPEDQLQPKLHTQDYAKPGDPLPKDRPQLFDIEKGKQLPVSDDLAPNPFYLDQVRWAKDSSRFTYVYNQRGHQVLRVVSVDAATGASKAIVDEKSDTFIHYSGKFFLEFLDDTNELVWMSERTGWNHLYLVDSRTGAVKNAITQGAWVVRGAEQVDPKTRDVFFRLSGYHQGQDPYYQHLAKVKLDGSGFQLLTDGNAHHSVQFSPDKSLYVETTSRVDLPPTLELKRVVDGSRVAVLENADEAPLVKMGWKAPERFTAKGRDGKTDIYGIILRPSSFDPKKKYPVVEYIYAGPHNSFVPKAYTGFYSPQFLAEGGFIVVQMDGMGTNNRGKAFHDLTWKNLGDSGFPDRIAWIKAAAAKYPQMDLRKGVGIYGSSSGGQSSLRALLAFGDFYTAAVSDSGCHDNRVDKIWWNEQWMGWPIGPHYAEQSNVTQAHKLKGKLLLTYPECDRNVDPGSTLQVADALIKADKDFELMVVPGADHWLVENAYWKRRMLDFFVHALK